MYGSTKSTESTSTTSPITNNTGSTAVVNTNNKAGKFIVHIVVKGETLYRIYKKYGVAVDQIKATNNLTSNEISVGQALKIPVK